MKIINFTVLGSDAHMVYETSFFLDEDGTPHSSCECKAAHFGMICKHRTRIALGNIQDITSSNLSDVQTVALWFAPKQHLVREYTDDPKILAKRMNLSGKELAKYINKSV